MSDPATPEGEDPFHGNPPSDLLRGAMGGGSSPPPESRTGWQPPEPEELARLLPQYAISHLIGRGGMGAVYQGVQLSLRREVAVKLLPPELGASPEFEARFRREAMAMARLNHPNIVQIHDYGQTAEGHHYIVMEYVDGTNLRHIIREGGLDAVEALRAVSQICDALEYAHAEGFVHRDIKPTNIFISRKGGLKIGDFGLVKLVGDDARTELGDEEDVTLTDMVMGTPHYIAPEQWYGSDAVDRRADIYSLGVMFYEMLTGSVPQGAFRAPSERIKALDVRIDGVVYRAMQEDPDDRYQSAADLQTDVDRIRTTPPVEPPAEEAAVGQGGPAPRRKSRSGISVSAAVVGLAAVVAVAGWWALRERSAGTPARNESSAPATPPPSAPEADKSVRAPADPSQATKEQPFENSLGMKFVPVPGTGVLFCIHETRHKDYDAYAKENPGIGHAWRNQTIDNCAITERAEDHPVVKVSWEEAQKFCGWLSKKEGRTYRLPTDEEWSYAVGLGGKERRLPGDTPRSLSGIAQEYPWGVAVAWPPPAGAGNYSDQSHKEKVPRTPRWPYLDGDDGYPTTAPVMSYAPNRFGLYDMGGNVRELVEDWFDEKQDRRATRGGSWFWGGEDVMRSSNRESQEPTTHISQSGFRLVFVVDGGIGATTTQPDADKSARAAADPSQASKEQPFVNSLGMKFVPVPETGVLFCIHETRYRDYAAYAKENPGIGHAWRDQTIDGFTLVDQPSEHPVWMVDWGEAKKFCEWLSKKEGKTYRLPTDEEWSVAVGLGRKERRSPGDTPRSLSGKVPGEYPWGKAWPPPVRVGNYSDQSRKAKAPRGGARYLEGYDDGFPTTAPVMSFAPNGLGLYDLGGNVWEWVDDWYDERQEHRLRRGGNWDDHTEGWMRSSARGNLPPNLRGTHGGFRVVLVADAATTPVQASAATTTPPVQEADKSVRAPAPAVAPSTNDEESSRGTPLPPEFRQRLDAYLAARRKALGDLAGRYTGALETRLSAAAAAGNLALATAYEEETARVEALRSSFGQTAENAAASMPTWPGLPALAAGAPDGLVDIRLVWETERGKIRADLDGKLAQSLQALESELTKARRLEEALAVKAHREGNLGKGPGAAAPAPKPGAVPPGRRFPVGTVAFKGRHFKVLGPAKTWNDARKQCKALDGRLAMPESAEENAFLMGLAREAGLRMLWLGATDERIEGKWTSEGKEVKYSNWDAPVQPNNGGGVEHYAVIHSLTTGRWWDFPDDPIAYPNLTGRTIPGAICQWDE